MALLTKSEFSELCGRKSNWLSTYIGRGEVVATGNLINDTLDLNKHFLSKHRKTPEIEQVKETVAKPVTEKRNDSIKQGDLFEKQTGSEAVVPFSVSETKLKFLDTQKREEEIAKLKLDNQKKRGEVIPSELIKPVFLRHNQSITTEFKNATDEILRSFSKRKSLSVNEEAELKGELIEIINSSMIKATNLTVSSIDNIINEYALKKGIGERN